MLARAASPAGHHRRPDGSQTHSGTTTNAPSPNPPLTDTHSLRRPHLTALRTLRLSGCTLVTNAGLQHLMSLTGLSVLFLYGTSTTQAGRNALKAALPALNIS